jgi:hypothetical protein
MDNEQDTPKLTRISLDEALATFDEEPTPEGELRPINLEDAIASMET